MGMHRRLLAPVIVLFLLAFPLQAAQQQVPEPVKKVLPSTVLVIAYDEKDENLANGGGFFISRNGDIVTTRRVLRGARRAEVLTVKGEIYPVRLIVAEDREEDLVRASVDVSGKTVSALPVSSKIPEVGERVIVVSSPWVFEQAFCEGIVSAIDEKVPRYGKLIWIDVPVAEVLSGSPVVNTKGEVIGVVTFFVKGEDRNIVFAFPAERVAALKRAKEMTLTQWWQATRAEGPFLAGSVFVAMEEYEKALSYFEQAVKKDPSYAEAYLMIGYCCVEMGRYTKAIEAYKQAIRIKPDYVEAHYGLGVVYGKLHRYTEAIEEYKQAIRIKPDFAEAHFSLGLTYLLIGDRASALDEYKILKDLNEELANELFDFIYK